MRCDASMLYTEQQVPLKSVCHASQLCSTSQACMSGIWQVLWSVLGQNQDPMYQSYQCMQMCRHSQMHIAFAEHEASAASQLAELANSCDSLLKNLGSELSGFKAQAAEQAAKVAKQVSTIHV